MQSYQVELPFVADADAEARRLGHSYIGPEHLLLAIATNAGGASRVFLDRHDLSRDTLRQSVSTLLGHELAPSTVDGPLRISLVPTSRSHWR